MKMKKAALSILAISFALMVTTAKAIPNFATKTGKNCSYCHTAWPQLNKKGRDFKEAGYRLPADLNEKVSDFFDSGEFPISAVLVARPYDKKGSGDRKLRALHEAEIMVAGVIGKSWSGFFEVEAEDEDLNARGFEVGIPTAQMTYHHNPAVNIQFSWSDVFYTDPYGFLGTGYRLTRGHVGAIDQKFGGADDSKLRSARQNLSVFGRPIDKLFYSIGLSGEGDDAEGVKGSNITARLAFDVSEGIMIGGFIMQGDVAAVAANNGSMTVLPCTGAGVPDASCADANDSYNAITGSSAAIASREYQRSGIDAQLDIGHTRVQLALLSATDDTTTPGTEVDNDALSIQAMHIFKTKTGKPTFVPLIRLDNYEQNNGADKYKEMTLNVSYYFTQNVKGYLEFWDRYDVPTGKAEDDRTTLQLFVAF